jgi:Arc/MetJ-type ribon-helix-helix transcriptional regulator
MSITLRPEHEDAVTRAIESGAYENPDQVIERALEVLRTEDGWLQDQKEQIAAKIDRALGDFERGEFFTEGESRADMQKRKATWLAQRKR